ncbi:DUF4097 family beta strand repeat-containing protein [Alkalihalobacterium chitinilyticum]|uniref:DUF4097 domain-containing protein n=1 Tax=Alkalihalobacterium chitinilyticum TaxID=2980103 RepID=A0ABT5VKL6_9BACI|nr:DUF4097 family beta strand repeat-containing protein [Alkalihalobacterium chitinilyticum]MDE5414988.1 DUF4097 domain-containing protein [Alkalihalobacterium chitinilyticum]
MKRPLGVLLIIIGILIAFSTIFQPLISSNRTSTVNEQGININNGYDKLSITTSVADLNIRQYPGEELMLEVKGNSSNYHIQSESKKSILEIEIKSNKRWQFFNASKSSVDVLIPDHYTRSVTIENTVGDLRFQSPLTLAELNIKMTAGDVKGLTGSIDHLTFHSTAGDFHAYDLNSVRTEIKGTAGDFQIERFTGDLKGTNTAGSITVEYERENGDIELQTTAGDVRLLIPEPSFELNASTTLGDVSINIPIMLEQSGKTYKGVVNNGEKKVKVSTTIGDIKID